MSSNISGFRAMLNETKRSSGGYEDDLDEGERLQVIPMHVLSCPLIHKYYSWYTGEGTKCSLDDGFLDL